MAHVLQRHQLRAGDAVDNGLDVLEGGGVVVAVNDEGRAGDALQVAGDVIAGDKSP